MLPNYPGIIFETVEENSFSLRQMLLAGTLDLVIDSSSTESPTLLYHDLFEEHILLAIPASDPINDKDTQLAPAGGRVDGVEADIRQIFAVAEQRVRYKAVPQAIW